MKNLWDEAVNLFIHDEKLKVKFPCERNEGFYGGGGRGGRQCIVPLIHNEDSR